MTFLVRISSRTTTSVVSAKPIQVLRVHPPSISLPQSVPMKSFRNLLQTRSKMSTSERNEALRDANEKMKFYFENRPSLKVLNKHKKKFGDDNQHFVMAGTLSTFLCLFLFTPFLGRKIAQDEDFREKYVPKFYDYSLEKPDYAWTRAELHEQMVQLQMDLHKRAINGEFTPEKIEEMRRHFDGVDPEEDKHGWGKLHPGVDDDEDIEED